MNAVGLLGGTFDPIHCGHLDVARAARQALGLDEVWLIPARHPPHRNAPVASAAHRFAMAALAVAGDASLRLCDVEMERDGPSFTIETLDVLELRYPEVRGAFVFVTGADAFRDIRTWRRWHELVDRCHFAVVSRPGEPSAGLRDALPELADRMYEAPGTLPTKPGIFLIEALTAAVSSTEVRTALAAGRPLEGLLPAAVATYAERHRLYPAPADPETTKG